MKKNFQNETQTVEEMKKLGRLRDMKTEWDVPTKPRQQKWQYIWRNYVRCESWDSGNINEPQGKKEKQILG